MEGFTNPTPRTVEEVFRDFRGRQAGLIKALTSLCLCSFLFYMVKLYQTCDPGELCLPQCFIHLLTVFYLSQPYGRVDLLILSVYMLALSSLWFLLRQRLFQMINDLPTIFEVVRTMMSMVALVALAETTSVQMSFGFAAMSVRNGSMEDV
ncbi:hypothetical protein F2Q68_00011317 [Brassica cretica]|uniref:PHD finger protein ALFIN-LIKE n=1 Tax=Brassica cretica TaxID=69181 RepID=A0A8S9KZ95_BRACR|nr:hypothetical protein F2Q68_00011317 [Brassica cretica]